MAGALRGRMRRLRRCWRAVWNSPLLSALESSGEQEGIQPGRCRAAGAAEESGASTLTVLRAIVQGISKASAPAQAECRQKACCASAMVPMLSLLTTQNSCHHRVSAWSCKASQCGGSCAPSGPSNGQISTGPWLAGWWRLQRDMQHRLPLDRCAPGTSCGDAVGG
jgi:hypothetical protein